MEGMTQIWNNNKAQQKLVTTSEISMFRVPVHRFVAHGILQSKPFRPSWQTKNVLTFVSTFSVGFGSYYLHSTHRKSLDGFLSFDNSPNLVLPTLEASIRALRLVSTAIRIIVDYEIQKLDYLSSWNFLSKPRHPERLKWEREIAKCRQNLEEAQIAYTSPKSDDEIHNSGLSREDYVRSLRNAVHQAAENLAKAEAELDLLGNDDSIHHTAANRLLNLCRKNGGVYIKIGQHLANLDYLIPSEYIKVLSSLYNDAPQSCKLIYQILYS
jgi:hypothetical protein